MWPAGPRSRPCWICPLNRWLAVLVSKGATENATVVKELLEDLVARGVNPDRKRLFIIDGTGWLEMASTGYIGCAVEIMIKTAIGI